jgi:hypothetical protein
VKASSNLSTIVLRAALAPAILLLCAGADPASVPTEPPPPKCVTEKVVSTSVGPTLKVLAPGRRIKQIVWVLSDGHTYTSQTGDDDAVPGKPPMTATQELQKPGTPVHLCSSREENGTYYRFIRTKDQTNRVVTLVK